MSVRDALPRDASAVAGLLAQLGRPGATELVAERVAAVTADAASRVLA